MWMAASDKSECIVVGKGWDGCVRPWPAAVQG